MSLIYITSGFHTSNSLVQDLNITPEELGVAKDTEIKLSMENVKGINLTNFLGYFPIAGLASAYQRISCLNKPSLSFRIYTYVRSFFESLGCGLIFLPFDLGISLYRHMYVTKSAFPDPNSEGLSYLDYFKNLKIFNDLSKIFESKQLEEKPVHVLI